MNHLRPSGLTLNNCACVHLVMKLFKNWKFTFFEVHTVLRDEFLRHGKFFHWKIWILSFQTPYRTSSYHSWMSFYSCVYSLSKMRQKAGSAKDPFKPTLLMISYTRVNLCTSNCSNLLYQKIQYTFQKKWLKISSWKSHDSFKTYRKDVWNL